MNEKLTRGQILAMKAQMHADGHGPWVLGENTTSAEEWARIELQKLELDEQHSEP
jgi:hypothetical protein